MCAYIYTEVVCVCMYHFSTVSNCVSETMLRFKVLDLMTTFQNKDTNTNHDNQATQPHYHGISSSCIFYVLRVKQRQGQFQ